MPTRPSIARALEWLRTGLRRFGRAQPRREVVAGFLTQIAACREGLHGFGQSSDQEFTDLAKGLSQLSSRLAAIRIQTAGLDAVLQDRDEERAISSAYALYKDSVDLVHANAGIAVSAQARLIEVETALMESCQNRQEFDRDLLFLRIVTLSIRIEASRLPPETQPVFLNVSSAIAETGDRIQKCTNTAFGRIETVISESRTARAELSATEKELQRKASASIDTIQRELSDLQAGLAPCVEQSKAIGELFTTAQPQTMAVIGALQHQDIVRQQLEHVSESFQDLEQHFEATQVPGGRSREGQKLEWNYVHQIARIQIAQLEASRTEIDGAGSAVIGGLQALLDTSTAMVERFSSMESAAATALDHCNIAKMFSRELQGLTNVIEQSQQANARTTRLVERIEEVVRDFSNEISRYDLDVKIVALNAQIAAARLSSVDALNRLAEETCKVSDANAQSTRKLTVELMANLEKLQLVKKEGTEFLTIVTTEKIQLERGLVSVTEKLARLVARVRDGSVQARSEFEPLHADCQALLAHLNFPTLSESTFAPALALSRALIALSTASVMIGAPSTAVLAKIKKHQDRYTMKQENATHATALQLRPVASADEAIELCDEPAPSSAVNGTRMIPLEVSPHKSNRVAAAPLVLASDKSFGEGIDLF